MDAFLIIPASVATTWIQRIGVTTIAIHYICALFFVIQQNLFGKSELSSNSKLQRALSYSIIFLVVTNLINWIYCHFIIYDLITASCHLIIALSTVTIMIARMAIYQYTLTRVQVIFNGSPGLEYSNKYINTAKLIILLAIMIVGGAMASPLSTYSYNSGKVCSS